MSFSAEIKDFVNGFNAGAQVGGDIQDRKLKREKFEYDKGQDALSNARADRALSLRERRARGKLTSGGRTKGPKAVDWIDGEAVTKDDIKAFNEVIGKNGTSNSSGKTDKADEYIPDDADSSEDDGYDTEETSDASDEMPEVDGEEVHQYTANGGMIAHAANGAIVLPNPDDEDEEAAGKDDSEAAEAIPTAAPAPAPAAAPAQTYPTVASGKSDPIFKETANIVRDVMDTQEKELGEPKQALPSKKSQDRVAEQKAATPDEIKAMWKKIDPNGEMNDQVKGAHTLVRAYKFFMQHGDQVKARKVAAQIIAYNKETVQMLGKFSLQLLREGDVASAAKLVSDGATNNVPDGTTVTAQATPNGTVLYKIDREGYAQQQGEIRAQQLWEIASGMADGGLFLDRMKALAAEGDPTAASNANNGDGKKKRRYYSQDVAEAAQAMDNYDTLFDAYENETDEDKKKAIGAKLKDARAAADKAQKRAMEGAKKTKRSMKELQADLKAARGNTLKALPDGLDEAPADAPAEGAAIDPEAPLFPNGQSAIGYMFGGNDGPAPATPAPPKEGRQIGEVRDSPKGKVQWTGEGWKLIGGEAQ